MVGAPKLIIADEPTTALDPTVQRRVVELLLEVQRDTGVGILLITHDLGLVAQTCDRVAVMYAGSVVERQAVEGIFVDPQHPYTSGLIQAIPQRGAIAGSSRHHPGHVVPPDMELPGCRFHPRCPHGAAVCEQGEPALVSTRRGVASRCVPRRRARADRRRAMSLLEVRDLVKRFPGPRQRPAPRVTR